MFSVRHCAVDFFCLFQEMTSAVYGGLKARSETRI